MNLGFCTRRALIRPFPKQNNGDCVEEDFEIEHHRLVLDVVQIEQHHLLEADLPPPRYLPETGHPRRGVGSQLVVPGQAILGGDVLEVGNRERARTDEAHFALEHVEELGKLIDAEVPEYL